MADKPGMYDNGDGSWTVAGFVNHYPKAQWDKIKATFPRRKWGIRVVRVFDSAAEDEPRHQLKHDPAVFWAAALLRSAVAIVMLAVLALAVIIA